MSAAVCAPDQGGRDGVHPAIAQAAEGPGARLR